MRYFTNLQPLIKLKQFKNTRSFCDYKRELILGIETSCDDTGCAIVNTNGNILGEALNSQLQIHLKYGGIIPPIARNYHRQNIEKVVNDAVRSANISLEQVSAIATTVKPGLPLSLDIGLKYGKYLSRKYKKPFIPIHHMEAHTLTARMINKEVHFPFLVLLISGGHCLLAIAKNINEYVLLGNTIDDAPGEAFDKTARRMKLRNIEEFSMMSGGQAIEVAASRANNPLQYEFRVPMLQYKDCNFSLAGLKNKVRRYVIHEEKNHNLRPDEVIPDIYNLCAGFQLTLTKHLCHRVQRAMEYVEIKGMIPENRRTLIVSGGSACNSFIKKALKIVCDELGYGLEVPPPKLCTDNGIMIAWNGVEKWKQQIDIHQHDDLDKIDIQKDCPLGVDISEDVSKEHISCKWVKLRSLLEDTQSIKTEVVKT